MTESGVIQAKETSEGGESKRIPSSVDGGEFEFFVFDDIFFLSRDSAISVLRIRKSTSENLQNFAIALSSKTPAIGEL